MLHCYKIKCALPAQKINKWQVRPVPFRAGSKYAGAALSSRLQQRVAATVAALTTRATMVDRNISNTRNKRSGGR